MNRPWSMWAGGKKGGSFVGWFRCVSSVSYFVILGLETTIARQ